MSDLIPSRKIKFYDTSTQALKVFESSAKTFGELKSVLSSLFGTDTRNGKFILAQLKLTLELDDAALPETDFVLTRTPASTKSATKKLSEEQKAANAEARKRALEASKAASQKKAAVKKEQPVTKKAVTAKKQPVVVKKQPVVVKKQPVTKKESVVTKKENIEPTVFKLTELTDNEIVNFANNIKRK